MIEGFVVAEEYWTQAIEATVAVKKAAIRAEMVADLAEIMSPIEKKHKHKVKEIFS